jgi:hypothetical protein
MGILPLGASPVESNLSSALTSAGGIRTNLGNTATLDVPLGIWRSQWYDSKLAIATDALPFYVMVYTDTPANAAGSLIVEYEYEFVLPIDPASGIYTSQGVTTVTMAGSAINRNSVDANVGSALIVMEAKSLGDAAVVPGDILIASSYGETSTYWRLVRAGTSLDETDLSGTFDVIPLLWSRSG